jgi:hypothetical protein
MERFLVRSGQVECVMAFRDDGKIVELAGGERNGARGWKYTNRFQCELGGTPLPANNSAASSG